MPTIRLLSSFHWTVHTDRDPRRTCQYSSSQKTRQGSSGPRVGVLIATCKRGAMVEESLRSVLEQSLPPHQVIDIDDGSTEATAERLAQRATHVEYFRLSNGGKSRALNAAMPHVTGDFDWVSLLTSIEASAVEARPGPVSAATSAVLHPTPPSTSGCRRCARRTCVGAAARNGASLSAACVRLRTPASWCSCRSSCRPMFPTRG